MTERELAEAEAESVAIAVPKLAAEVRRLREALKDCVGLEALMRAEIARHRKNDGGQADEWLGGLISWIEISTGYLSKARKALGDD